MKGGVAGLGRVVNTGLEVSVHVHAQALGATREGVAGSHATAKHRAGRAAAGRAGGAGLLGTAHDQDSMNASASASM